MKFKMIEQGNDGFRHYNPGDEVDRPSEWLLRCIALGAAEPVDDEAKQLVSRMSPAAPTTEEK